MILEFVRTAVGGFLMGSADLVPGVSGGTIALVIGIYERLVASIREGSSALGALVRRDISGFTGHFRSVEWPFLLTLLAGILAAVLVLSSLIDALLEEQPIIVSAAFFGLVIGSQFVAWRLIRAPDTSSLVIALLVGVAFFLLLGFRSETEVTAPGVFAFLGAGALAICAMILPGISGSLILVLIGMYEPVLDAVNERDLAQVGLFALGAVVGLALFSQVLHWALEHYHDAVLAGLIGLMAGSLRILWPWPNGVDGSALGAPDTQVAGAIGAAMAGLVAVFVIARLGLKSVET